MLARASLISLVTLASPLLAQDYDGKFADHPNLEKVMSIAESVAAEAPKKLPKWLIKKTPSISVVFIDAKEPLGKFGWPGKVPSAFQTSTGSKNWSATISLTLDSLIRDPSLVEPALRRQIFGVTALQEEFAAGASIMNIGGQGLANPIIDAIAAHWAGSLEQEIDYGLRRQLEDIDATMGLVTDIELTDNGSKLAERPEGDLTLLMLASVLAPTKSDKKLAKLFQSITRKQPLKQGLEKAGGKKMDRLNQELHKALTKRLKDSFVKLDRPRYKNLMEAYRKQEWMKASELTRELNKEDGLLGPNLFIFRAMCIAGIEEELGRDTETSPGHILLAVASTLVGSSPFAVEAQLHLAESLQKAGDNEGAKEAWTTLRDEFGWQPGWSERATAALEALEE